MARFVPRPDHVFIGNHTYSIEWLNSDEWLHRDFDMSKDGLTYAATSRIFVRLIEGRREALYQEIVLHEVTHAIWDTVGVSLDPHWDKVDDSNDLEEKVILFQSPMLLFVMKHNPDLVAWLLADGNDER